MFHPRNHLVIPKWNRGFYNNQGVRTCEFRTMNCLDVPVRPGCAPGGDYGILSKEEAPFAGRGFVTRQGWDVSEPSGHKPKPDLVNSFLMPAPCYSRARPASSARTNAPGTNLRALSNASLTRPRSSNVYPITPSSFWTRFMASPPSAAATMYETASRSPRYLPTRMSLPQAMATKNSSCRLRRLRARSRRGLAHRPSDLGMLQLHVTDR
jgi:hypothetical protein